MFDYGRAAELSRKLGDNSVCARAMLIMWTVGEPCHSFQDVRTTHRDLVGVLMVSLSPGHGWIGDAGTIGTLSIDRMVLLALQCAASCYWLSHSANHWPSRGAKKVLLTIAMQLEAEISCGQY